MCPTLNAADTSPEEAESQALLDEAMAMATGTAPPIRAPVREREVRVPACD